MRERLFKTKDLYLFGMIIVAGILAVFIYNFLYSGEGTRVVISVDGVDTATYSLLESRELVVPGYDGLTCTVVIRDGRVSVSHADCPDKICVAHHEISGTGECIVCLPSRIIARVEGDTPAELDAVVR